LTAMLINDPATVAELHELYPRYEHALVTNDVETLVKARPGSGSLKDGASSSPRSPWWPKTGHSALHLSWGNHHKQFCLAPESTLGYPHCKLLEIDPG